MLDVTLLGTGGMLPLPDRALTALYVRHGARALLIDCGEGTQTAIRRCSLRFKSIEAILITHFHADHLSGLPGLLLTLGNETREEPLHIIGPVGLEKVVRSLLVIAPEVPFEIVFHEIDKDDAPFDLAGLRITPFAADHGIPCLGYHLSLPRPGKFDAKKARANGVPQALWNALQRGESAEGFSPEDVLGPARRGLSLLYATDTRPVPAIAQLGKDADLLILEGMFGDPAKQARAEETHHMMMHEAAQLAREANAKALWLTHYSPATREVEQYEPALRDIFQGTTAAADGQSVTLRFENE